MMRRETLTKYRNLYWNNQHTVNILETPKTWQMLFSGDLVSYEIKWSQASPVTPHQQLTLCMRERLWGALQLDIYDISNLQSSVSPPLFILLCHSPREPNAFPLPNMGACTSLLLPVRCCRQLSHWLLTVFMMWNNTLCTRLKTWDNINVIVTSSDFSDYTTHQTAAITGACNNYIEILMISFRL